MGNNDTKKKIDIHFHALGNGKDLGNVNNDIYKNFEDNHIWYVRLLHSSIQNELERLGIDFDNNGEISTDEYFNLIYTLFTQSKEINGIVLLAMDAVWDLESGDLDEKRTDLYITNTYLFNKVEELNNRLQGDENVADKSKTFYLGASVSPNRPDWETELDKAFDDYNAVLLKWIPSAQHIDLRKKAHEDFYQAFAEKNKPLLCHAGPEYSFPEGRRKKKLDNFKFLEYPLQHDIKVIAAHCAMPVFPLINKNKTKKFLKFMESANSGDKIRMWADTSALTVMMRAAWIDDVAKKFPPEWLVHGSDYPLPFDHWPHQAWLRREVDTEEYTKIKKEQNPLDKDILIKRAYDFPDSIIENTATVLGL